MLPSEITETRTSAEMVGEFMDAFEVPRTEATRDLYAALIKEEAKEVAEALANLLKELVDLSYVVNGYDLAGGDMEAGVDLIEGIIDEDLLIDAMHLFPQADSRIAFVRVHRSNMSKLGADGKPVRRPEDNKVLKGPNYKPADLSDLIAPSIPLN